MKGTPFKFQIFTLRRRPVVVSDDVSVYFVIPYIVIRTEHAFLVFPPLQVSFDERKEPSGEERESSKNALCRNN